MPEFIADTDGTVNGQAWDDLSPFMRGYVEAMLFTESAPGESMVEWDSPETQEALEDGTLGGNIPGDSGWGDIHPDSAIGAHNDCSEFQRKARHLLSQVYGHEFPARIIGDGSLPDSHRPAWDYDAEAAGRDFWYTRNGHGVGFWDRGLGELGDQLTAIAKEFGEVYTSFEPDPESPTGYGYVHLS